MRIHHVGVTVRDMDASLRFYRDLLGLTVLDRGVAEGAWISDIVGVDGAVIETADLDAGGGQIIELLAYRVGEEPVAVAANAPGGMHVAVTVASVAETLERIAAAGGSLLSRRPVTLTSPGSAWDGLTVAYTRDPDGAIVELISEPR
jgi:catechol 2,3-dioxygenase-like lactoylglutathione lyase family enzyme